MIQEKTRTVASGYLALVVLPALLLIFGWMFERTASSQDVLFAVIYALLFVVVLVCFKGFFMVHPNQAKVLQLFGTYAGSVRQTGLRWANPFCSKTAISLRVRNLATSYPYEDHEPGQVALRSDPQAIAEKLRDEVQDRLDKAGVNVIEARKAAMVCNLLVVLCGEENAQPALNAGSLY